MMMGTGSTTTVAMPSTSSATSTATSTSSSDDMDMDMDSDSMSMNMYLKADYSGYPVIFKSLKASSRGKAFAIFVILFFVAFFFRGISFLSAYIEQRIFQNFTYSNETIHDTPSHKLDSKSSTDIESSDHIEEEHDCCAPPKQTPEIQGSYNPINDQRSPLAKFLHFTPVSIYRDFIRLCLTIISTMIGYVLMLAVMTFILPYFFAIVLGISFGEIFFMRLSIAFGIRPPESVCSSLH